MNGNEGSTAGPGATTMDGSIRERRDTVEAGNLESAKGHHLVIITDVDEFTGDGRPSDLHRLKPTTK